MVDLFQAYGLAINIFIYIAVFLHFITKKTMVDRIHLVITVVGFFAILHFFEGNLFYAQSFFVVWLVVSGVKLMLPREVLLILLAAMLFLPTLSPFFVIITFLFYVTVIWGFIYYAFQDLLKTFPKS